MTGRNKGGQKFPAIEAPVYFRNGDVWEVRPRSADVKVAEQRVKLKARGREGLLVAVLYHLPNSWNIFGDVFIENVSFS